MLEVRERLRAFMGMRVSCRSKVGRVQLIISGLMVDCGDPTRRHPTDRCISPNQNVCSA